MFDEKSLRAERNARLVASDTLMYSKDRGVTDDQLIVLETYRVELRDSMAGVTDTSAHQIVLPVPADPDLCELLGLPDEHQSVDLSTLEAAALEYVDEQAEAQRLRFISAGDGQAMAYLKKADQAVAYLRADNPADVDYPWLSGEALESGMTTSEFAQFVAENNRTWGAVGPAVERIKAATKAAVRAAGAEPGADQHSIRKAVITDWSAVDAAYSAAVAPE